MNFFKKEPTFRFTRFRYWAFVLSGAIILGGIFVYIKNGFAYGIDFAGGTMVEVAFRENRHISQIRSSLNAENMGDTSISRVGKENKYFIRSKRVSEKDIQAEKMEDHEVIGRKIKRALMYPEEKEALDQGKLDLNNSGEGEISIFLKNRGIVEEDALETARLINDIKKSEQGLINSFSDLEKRGVKKRIVANLKEWAFVGNYSILSMEIVGPQVGESLKEKATWACIFALLAILVYIAFRFKRFLFGLSGVLTLFHDVLVSLSFILFFRIELSMQVVAAILTIVGYSINDTIVVFDRLRENLRALKKENLEEILDKSLNQTLSRSIITSFTVLLTVLALYFFGGEVIYPFAFVMLVGVISGSYSTIYQSCAWLKIWEKSLMKRKKF